LSEDVLNLKTKSEHLFGQMQSKITVSD